MAKILHKELDVCSYCDSGESKTFWDYDDRTMLCDDCHKEFGENWAKLDGLKGWLLVLFIIIICRVLFDILIYLGLIGTDGFSLYSLYFLLYAAFGGFIIYAMAYNRYDPQLLLIWYFVIDMLVGAFFFMNGVSEKVSPEYYFSGGFLGADIIGRLIGFLLPSIIILWYILKSKRIKHTYAETA